MLRPDRIAFPAWSRGNYAARGTQFAPGDQQAAHSKFHSLEAALLNATGPMPGSPPKRAAI